MARFGNSSTSSLFSSANAAATKTQSLNDSLAGYNYELSAKDEAAFNAYSSYLTSQAQKTSDPSKQLTYEKALTSAHKSYTSAEISRASTAVDYGEIDNTQKYSVISQLRDAAIQNGDEATAQSLEAKMAGLSMTIQNQQIAAENKASAASDKAARDQETAITKGASKAVGDKEDLIVQLNGLKTAGKITPAQYDDRMRQIYLGNPATGAQGLLSIVQAAKDATGDPNGTYQDKLNKFGADTKVQSYINGNKAAQGAVGDTMGQVMIKHPDGTYEFKTRDAGQLDANSPSILLKDDQGNVVKDANGHAITVPNYQGPQAFTDKGGAVTGFQYATSIDPNTGQPTRTAIPGKGPGGIRQINKESINNDDPSGVPYFYTEAGAKKFIGKDPKNGRAIMADDPSVITGKFDYGSTSVLGNTTEGEYATKHRGSIAGGSAGSLIGGIFSPVGGLVGGIAGSILGNNAQHKQELANAQAALAKVQAATAAAQQAAAQAATARAKAPAATASPAIAAPVNIAAGKPMVYLPSTPSNPLPTQNYASATSAYKDPKSTPAIASGIAAAVGYNPFPKF